MSLEEELQKILELCKLCKVELQGISGLSPYISTGGILRGFHLIDTGISSSRGNTCGKQFFLRTDGLGTRGVFHGQYGELEIYTGKKISSRQEALLAAIEVMKHV